MRRRTAALVTLLLAAAPLAAQQPRALRPTVFAVRDARVVPAPGQVLAKATVVIRDGLIEAVGADVTPPADALVIDGTGLTVYPGLIDAGSHWGFDPALRRSAMGPAAPEDYASEALAATKPDNRKGLTPEFLVQSALKMEEESADAWRKLGFTARLVLPEGGIVTGQSALVSLSDAPPREAVLRSPVALHAALRPAPGPDYPRVLMGTVAHARQFFLDAGHHRRLWAAFEQRGRSGRRPPVDPALEAVGPALERKQPVAFEADSRDAIERALAFADEFGLKPIIFGGRDAWKVAAELKRRDVPVILRLPLSEPNAEREAELPKRVRDDLERQRKEEAACAAELHKAGVRFALATSGLAADQADRKFRPALLKVIKAGLPADEALKALTVTPAEILGAFGQLGTLAKGKAAHLVVTDGDFDGEKTRVRYVFADGVRFEFEAKDKPKAEEKKTEEKKDEKKSEEKQPAGKPAAAAAEVASELEADRHPKQRTGGNLLLKNATVITITQGTKPNCDVLVRDSKVSAVGPNLSAPAGVAVIDATGLFVMPGIIDTHSHFAIEGGVNEFSLSIVPEVRVRDVINSEDPQIWRALAGGVTTARLLHGSANVVGGQDAVVKMKYGRSPGEMLVPGAPRGVKFALGENVKRQDGRFPNTRLGVEALLVRAFTEAQDYRRRWDDYESRKRAGEDVPEPRRDLRLEALADVLRGDLKVHCHCYRADEILMLLRVAEQFGFRVQSLQHVLEGYKVAPEIAAHGASCSLFADWWAYKIEAADAIPFAVALLSQAGVSVCLKSDSNELMRHLYQEAAKCVKYGGLGEDLALRTITLHAARQLGLEKRLGSIEPGKDGDLAVFDGHPLNGYSKPVLTVVEGEIFFQRGDRPTPRPEAAASPARPALPLPLPARNPDGRYLIRNVTVHPVTGPAIADGAVLIDRGVIRAVGRSAEVAGADVTVMDGRGAHLYPGMIDAGTVLGLTELDSSRETHDYAEGGDFQPDLRASVALNPDSDLIPVTRANGVLAAVVRPSGAVVAGQAALVNLAGWVPREMVLEDPLALSVDFPSGSVYAADFISTLPFGRGLAKKQRDEKIRRLRDLFRQAVAYDEGRQRGVAVPLNPRLEAVVPYARGKKPVLIEAYKAADLREALKLADELKLKIILAGATDAWKLADELKKRDIPVVLGPVMAMPAERHDPYDAPFACAEKLRQAGVRFCIRSSGAHQARNLPYEAAMAVAYGLPPEEGLKAVTLYPAQILGVEDRLGSVAVGKRANLVLTNGDLLQPTTQVLALFIDGRPLEPTSKQTRLYERYRERLREVQQGQSPPGTKD